MTGKSRENRIHDWQMADVVRRCSLVAREGPAEHDLAGVLVLPHPHLVRRPPSCHHLRSAPITHVAEG